MYCGEIARKFKTIWSATPVLRDVPLFYELASQVVNPYCHITVERVSTEVNTGQTYLSKYRVEIHTYGLQLIGDSQAFSQVIGQTYDRTNWIFDNTQVANILTNYPVAASLKYRQTQVNKVVPDASHTWEVLVQETII